jgi:hypothetical protein
MSGFRMGSNWELCRFSEALFFFSRDIVFRMSSTQSVSWNRGVRASVADTDPGSGAFLTPGSGMGKKSGSGSGMNNLDHIS